MLIPGIPSPFDHCLRSDEWTARLHDHHVLGYVGVYVDDLLIASDQVPINLPAFVGCLNWIALRTRPDIAWATSRAASLITHDPDTCFIRVKHICQYLHHTLSYALRCVPIPPQSKQKLWVLGDASFAPTGEKSQQGIVVYHGITSSQRQGGTLSNGDLADKI